jgi:hypothetical protein
VAGSKNAVEAVIRVRNEASTGLDQFASDIERSHRGIGQFASAISALNPTLATAIETVNRFVISTRSMNSATQAATVGLGVGIAALGAYTVALTHSIDKQLAFTTALRSMDVGQLRGQIASATGELDRLDATLSKLGQNTGWAQAFRNVVGLISQAPASLMEILGFSQTPESRRGQAIPLLNTLSTIQGGQRALEIQAAARSSTMGRLSGELGYAAQGGQFLSVESIGRQIEAQAQQQLAEQLLALQKGFDLARAQRPADQSIEDIRLPYEAQRRALQEQFRTGASERALQARTLSAKFFDEFFGGVGAEQFQPGQGLEQVSAGEAASDPLAMANARAAGEQIRRDIIAEIIGQISHEDAAALLGGAEQIGVGPTPAEIAKGGADRVKRLTEARDLELQITEIAASYTGLTKEQNDALQAQVIERTRLRDLAAAGADENLKELANTRAAMAQINLELARLQRDNPLAGLAKGFKDVAEAAESSGQVMQDFARNTASSMQHAFSDLFFNVVTGNFKNFADVGKQLGLSLARNFTDALATSATAPILRGLAGLTSGFFPASGVSLVNLAPEGSALSQSLQRAGFNVGGTGGGGGGAPALYGDIYSGQTAQGFVESSPLSGGGPSGLAAGPGLLSGFTGENLGGLGIGLAGVGLGILASQYSGMTAGAFGAASTGLTAGAGIATLLGAGTGVASGVGALAAVVAMVAYLAISGATAARNDRPNTGWRAIELGNVLNADVARIRAARSFVELANAIREAMHQAFGGPKTGYVARQTAGQPYPVGRGGSMATAGFAVAIAGQQVVLDGGSYPQTMTVGDFAVLLSTQSDTFNARLQLGAPEQYLREIDNAFEQAVKDQAKMIQAFGTIPVSFDDVGPGLRRTTLIAAGALDTFPGVAGHALSIDRQFGRSLGLTDDQIDNMLRRLSDRNTQTDRFPDLPRDVRLIL